MYNSLETDIVYTIIYILFLSYVLWTHQRKIHYRVGAGSIVLLSYIIYPIIGAFWFFDIKTTYGQFSPLRLFPFLYLALMLSIAIKPILQYDRLSIKKITPPSMNLIYIFVIVYTLCAFFSMKGVLNDLSTGIYKILMDNSAGAELYADVHKSTEIHTNLNITNIFSIIFNTFSPLAFLCFFYYLTIPKRNTLLVICLGFCLIIKTLRSVGLGLRTETTMCVFNVLGAFLITKPMLSEKILRIARISIITILFAIAIPFVALSVSRFGDSEMGTSGGMIYYIGQSPYIFNEYAFEAAGGRHGDRTCNYFKHMFGIPAPEGVMGVRAAYPDLALHDDCFSTFVGDFVVDFGIIVTVIMFITFSLLFSSLTLNNGPNQIPFYRLILLFFATSVCLQGGMYLFSYSFGENITILATLFSYIIFSMDYHLRRKLNSTSIQEKHEQ